MKLIYIFSNYHAVLVWQIYICIYSVNFEAELCEAQSASHNVLQCKTLAIDHETNYRRETKH